jgi:cyclic pyranopterin phosphate synthase
MTIALPILDTQPFRPHFAQGPRSLSAVKLLRISVTDRCNLRCMYCMPVDGVSFTDRDELLGPADFAAVAQAARQAGVTHFKLTGGEPTIRNDLLDIVARIKAVNPVDLSLTTNGLKLDKLAAPLRDAGVDRLTVSCDSLRADRFARITNASRSVGARAFDQLWRGIEAAEAAGFERLKINVVVIGGVNDDEAADFAKLTVDKPWTVRFIEYMPLGDSAMTPDADHYTVSNEDIRQRISETCGELSPVDRESEAGVGPAEVYRLPGNPRGRVGFISAMSQPFCETCNRLRLTATGELRACLFDGGEVNLLPALRPQADTERLIGLMASCVAQKPDTHSGHGNRQMSQMGG